MNPPWSSLEVAKLVAASATPILILLLGVLVQRAVRRIEAVQWANRKIIEKRLTIYDELAPLLNDLLCFFIFVGNWKELTPPGLIASKRVLDKKVHLAAPLFSPEFLELYHQYMQLCFLTFNRMGEDAKLRTRWVDRAQHSAAPWQEEWANLFADPSAHSEPKDVIRKYDQLMACFSRELGLGLAPPPPLLSLRRVGQKST